MSHPQQTYQPPHYYPPYPTADQTQSQWMPNGQGYHVQTEQPYQPYPMTAPQTTVFIYDEAHLNRRRETESGILAALCAACLCCWLLPMPVHHH